MVDGSAVPAFGFLQPQPRTIPDNLDKRGTRMPGEKAVQLVSNYAPVRALGKYAIYMHAVHFEPEQDHTGIRRALVRVHAATFGLKYIFDGATLYTFDSIGNETEPLVFTSVKQTDQSEVTITVKLTKTLPSTDPQFLQASVIFLPLLWQWRYSHDLPGTSVHANLRF
jgi:hypothetical protein